MINKDERRLTRHFHSMERKLPPWIGRPIRWLRMPSSRWVRLPVGLLLIAAGLLSFLPLLGLWMLPLGLLLLAEDVPVLRRPMLRAMLWVERRWLRWRRSRKRARRGA